MIEWLYACVMVSWLARKVAVRCYEEAVAREEGAVDVEVSARRPGR